MKNLYLRQKYHLKMNLLEERKFNFQNFLNNLNLPNVSNSYFKYGGILLISIILLVLMFAITDDEEIDLSENKEKVSESLEIENQDLLISSSEEELLNENPIKNDIFLNDEIIDDLSQKI